MNAGEAWAYRARTADPLVEVKIVRIGSRRPARILARFVAPEFEGREDWIPPARLKVPWTQAAEFTARERRWTAIGNVAQIDRTPEHHASSWVFSELIDPSLASTDANKHAGVSRIHDVAGLCEALGEPPGRLREGPLSFVEDGHLIVPWPTTEFIAQTVVRRNPDLVLRHVTAEQTAYSRKMTHGVFFPATQLDRGGHADGGYYARKLDDPQNRPCWQLLRRWCGANAVERHDELEELRREVTRLSDLVQTAVEDLRAAGRRREAQLLAAALRSTVRTRTPIAKLGPDAAERV